MSSVSSILEAEPAPRKPDIGLEGAYMKNISELLSDILVETYQLTIRSHVYHWNVVGPLFKPIHELTEEHYQTLFAATDVIAERIRALGSLAPASLAQTGSFAPDGKDVGELSAADMVDDLITSHETAVRKMREGAKLAGDHDDVVTGDMLTERMAFHEEALWMLRSIIAR